MKRIASTPKRCCKNPGCKNDRGKNTTYCSRKCYFESRKVLAPIRAAYQKYLEELFHFKMQLEINDVERKINL